MQGMTTKINNRFDYVTYDETAQKAQTESKTKFVELETWVNENIQDGRSKSLVLTKLEEAYMWVGKGIKNDQWTRTGNATLQETRNAS